MCHHISTYLDRKIQVGQILQYPVHNTLNVVLSKVLGNRVGFQQGALVIGDESILTKVPNDFVDNAFAELFFLLGKIGAADNAHRDLFSKLFQSVHHVVLDFATRNRQSAIDVKQGRDTGFLGCWEARHGAYCCLSEGVNVVVLEL